MKSINVELTDEEFEYLKRVKTGSWKGFLFDGIWLKGILLRKPKDNFEGWSKNGEGKKHKRVKPCHKIGFCAYGQLVEEFPLYPEFIEQDLDLNQLAREGKLHTKFSCKVFGHDCPVFYCAEPLSE